MASIFSSIVSNVESISRNKIIFTVTAVTTATVFIAIKLFYKKRQLKKNVATVTKLMIFPIKSVAGIQVDELIITPNGARYKNLDDRSMILLNKDNRMITLRQNGSLIQIKSTCTGDGEVTLKAQDMQDLIINVNTIAPGKGDDVIHFSVWGYDTSGVEVSPEASAWFSRFLNESGVRLVIFTDKSQSRPTEVASTSGSKWNASYPIRYQDGSPIHLCNEATLHQLNLLAKSSDKYFDINAFRPNIVVKSLIAGEEISWYSCIINSITLYNVRACTRCVIPTIDLSTGERDAEKSPIMQSHRSAKNEYEEKNYRKVAMFGVMLVPNKRGTVTLGSIVDATV